MADNVDYKALYEKSESSKKEAADRAEKAKREADERAERADRLLKEAEERAEKIQKEADERARKIQKEADERAEKAQKEADERARKIQKEAEERENKRQKEAEERAEKAQREADERARKIQEEADERVKAAEKRLAKTTYSEFLEICHCDIFLKLQVQKNKLLSTSGGMTRVDGKQYPRRLMPWTEAAALFEEHFAVYERAFKQLSLLPSSAGLEYVSDRLRNKKLASEEDLKNFECLAVEGCALDAVCCFLELVNEDKTLFSFPDPPPSDISFNNYPFGVIAALSDEEKEKLQKAEDKGQDTTAAEQPQSSRGRRRNRGGRGRGGKSKRSSSRKPLVIKDDRPAYIGALGVAKRDMDEAIERAAKKAEERDKEGPDKKRRSPERTKVHPDQWCFWYNDDDAANARPLFVIEYKAAHKVDNDLLRSCLQPEAAATLMEDAIRSLTGRKSLDSFAVDKRDIAKIFTQTYHYMIDYGLQYSYMTTGYAFVFLYLDPLHPTTLYYHLEEPKLSVLKASQREDIKHSAVALVLSFVLMSTKGVNMSQLWKKNIQKQQPKWPQAYTDMGIMPADEVSSAASLTTTTIVPAAQTPAACSDPQKQSGARQRDQDDDEEPGPAPRPGGAASLRPAEKRALTSRTAQSSSEKGTSSTGTAQDSRQAASAWTFPANAPPSVSLAYCTQACLLGLRRGGKLDPQCPNVDLHRRGGANAKGTHAGQREDELHPISASELRTLLTQQLADNLDQDCQNLERFGMYGAIGAMFKLALAEYGYCLVGKGVQRVHRKKLEKEALVYGCLEACQGRLVPVNMGVIELVDEYWTQCGAHISHMMLLSFSGDSIWHHLLRLQKLQREGKYVDMNLVMRFRSEAERTMKELKPYGVDQGDEDDNNIVWNEELQRIMLIDFDQAAVLEKQQERLIEVDLSTTLSAGRQGKRRKTTGTCCENNEFEHDMIGDDDSQETKRPKLLS